MEITIRAVTKEDINKLRPLMINYIADFYQRPCPEEKELEKFIVHLIEHPREGKQFVAERNGSLIGFATLYFTYSTLQLKRAAIMNDLFVGEEYRGEKVGEKLFNACLEYIRMNGFAYMSWETARDNIPAQAFYRKMGGHPSEWMAYEIS
ncbi:GNAT family N-acetyltransferase [Peribacillus sp. SCS-155]|uniref:GNAT family N-acetyltransferase n=1 Tax=Peribacillus sedimenti TaxID=3115297 RepID=UPI003905A82D